MVPRARLRTAARARTPDRLAEERDAGDGSPPSARATGWKRLRPLLAEMELMSTTRAPRSVEVAEWSAERGADDNRLRPSHSQRAHSAPRAPVSGYSGISVYRERYACYGVAVRAGVNV